MAQFNHTEGPWSLKLVHTPSDSYGHWYHSIQAGDGYSANGFTIDGIVGPADARLMTASPDLLAALKELMEASDDPALDDREDDGYRAALDRQSEAMKAAAAAVAKAEGE